MNKLALIFGAMALSCAGHALSLTGYWEQMPHKVGCPSPLSADQIDDATLQVGGYMDLNDIESTPFANGKVLFTNINKGPVTDSVGTQTTTTQTDNSIVTDRQVMENGRVVQETQMIWTVTLAGARLESRVLKNQADMPAVLPMVCEY